MAFELNLDTITLEETLGNVKDIVHSGELWRTLEKFIQEFQGLAIEDVGADG